MLGEAKPRLCEDRELPFLLNKEHELCEAQEASTESCSSASSSKFDTAPIAYPSRSLFQMFLRNMGPGLMACLADTDGPCLITAAQSGADWGYSLLSLQIVLIPVLFIAQELTARLGIVRGLGMTAILRTDIGPWCSWLVSVPLLVACLLGLVSEFSIIGKTMAFWGVNMWQSNAIVTFSLLAVVATGSYSAAERVGLIVGSAQVAFFVTVFFAGPQASKVFSDAVSFPLGESGFVRLITANIGAVIMPWMLAYQQSAICNKGLSVDDDTAFGRSPATVRAIIARRLLLARLDTALGCVLTQGVMAAMLVTVAAANVEDRAMDTVDDLLALFTHVLGGNAMAARVLLTFAIIGACMVAAIVQTLCAAWTFEQALGHTTASLSAEPTSPKEESASSEVSSLKLSGWALVKASISSRPTFYASYATACAGASVVTLIAEDAVVLSVLTEFCNGVLMPPVVISLWYLAAYKLPDQYKLNGLYKWSALLIFMTCSIFCLGSIFFSFKA